MTNLFPQINYPILSQHDFVRSQWKRVDERDERQKKKMHNEHDNRTNSTFFPFFSSSFLFCRRFEWHFFDHFLLLRLGRCILWNIFFCFPETSTRWRSKIIFYVWDIFWWHFQAHVYPFSMCVNVNLSRLLFVICFDCRLKFLSSVRSVSWRVRSLFSICSFSILRSVDTNSYLAVVGVPLYRFQREYFRCFFSFANCRMTVFFLFLLPLEIRLTINGDYLSILLLLYSFYSLVRVFDIRHFGSCCFLSPVVTINFYSQK